MAGLKLPMRKVLKVADAVYKEHGKELVVTSALDGTHSAGSYHYYGYALDFRTRYFDSQDEKTLVARKIREKLGDKYRVILESTHLHIQYNA